MACLSLADAELKAKPHIQAKKMAERLGLEVEAAYDGMSLNF